MAHNFPFNKISKALILSITFLKFCSGIDTLFPNQTIAVGQALVSQSQIFELGFFTPGKSRVIFLGIWYKATPDVVVWVANRNNPITDSQGATFAISGNGSLVISRGGSIFWSANSSGVASNTVLQLLDTGNLVLVDDTGRDETTEGYIWQSFDYPTDTWLPGMKMVDDTEAGVEKYLTSWRNSDDPSTGDFVFRIENQGLAELAISRGKTKKFRTGKWNGHYLSGTVPFPNAIFKPELVFNQERLISIWWPHDSSTITRLTMESSGILERYTMNVRKDRWNPVYANPKDPCDAYGLCGPFGISIQDGNYCGSNKQLLQGKHDWRRRFWSWCLFWQAWLLWKQNRILEIMDECLNDTFVESQVKRCIQVALLCVQKFAEDRPIMSSVLFMLGTDGAILPEPKEPGFFIERSCSPARSCTAPSISSENETITITDLEAR